MRISLGDVTLWFDVSGPSVVPRADTAIERPALLAPPASAATGGRPQTKPVTKPKFPPGQWTDMFAQLVELLIIEIT